MYVNKFSPFQSNHEIGVLFSYICRSCTYSLYIQHVYLSPHYCDSLESCIYCFLLIFHRTLSSDRNVVITKKTLIDQLLSCLQIYSNSPWWLNVIHRAMEFGIEEELVQRVRNEITSNYKQQTGKLSMSEK